MIEDGMTVVLGGYTACGYSKTIAAALAARKTGGEQLQFDLVPPSFTGPEIYETLGPAGILRRCTPLIESRVMSDLANKRKLHYVEQQMTTLSKQYAPEPGNSTRYDELYNDFIDLESKLWEA